jgi:hypothetical protein
MTTIWDTIQAEESATSKAKGVDRMVQIILDAGCWQSFFEPTRNPSKQVSHTYPALRKHLAIQSARKIQTLCNPAVRMAQALISE